jgi:hypothetical protein
MPSIPEMHPTTFDWISWTGGSITDLGIPCRMECITSSEGKRILRKYAIGYVDGKRLMCRPKENEVAVYFIKDEREFWFHLRKEEFDLVFGDKDAEKI